MSIASWTSPPASAFTFPISCAIRSVSSALWSTTSCAKRNKISPRFGAGTSRHSSNASFAAATARSTSSPDDFGKTPIVSPSAGLTDSNVSPDAASTHSPPMKFLKLCVAVATTSILRGALPPAGAGVASPSPGESNRGGRDEGEGNDRSARRARAARGGAVRKWDHARRRRQTCGADAERLRHEHGRRCGPDVDRRDAEREHRWDAERQHPRHADRSAVGHSGRDGFRNAHRQRCAGADPFQQIVFASTGGGGEDCVAISVPSGKILTIQSFAAVVNRNGPLMPAAYIRVDASLPSSTSFRRPLQLDLRPAVADDFAGDAQTLLISGAVDPNGYSFAYDACVIAGAGTSATMSAVVSGYLTNA